MSTNKGGNPNISDATNKKQERKNAAQLKRNTYNSNYMKTLCKYSKDNVYANRK
ncbi:hypothetical protein MM59RIKEN_10000 [Pusillibacter faecalis]|uniref:Uncharacterized protein n=1 Tax=Pusillibacter faecalis TaxID=2714358 RepID=A0A810QDE1_9FIRM|nr:hypothetical protein MM59RIKEN_10000 [Pusillibacter faecalis]